MGTRTKNAWAGQYYELLKVLPDGQASVIRQAALNGGYITRAEAQDLTGRTQFTGFCKAVEKHCNAFRTKGLVGPLAPNLLVAVYYGENQDRRIQPSVGFRVPFEAVEIALEWTALDASANYLGVKRRY